MYWGEPEARHVELQWECLPLASFSLSSVGTILLNRAAVVEFREPLVVMMTQNIATVAILQTCTRVSLFTLDMEKARRWAPCALLSYLSQTSSLMSLLFIRPPTFMVLQTLQPIFACAAECVVYRRIESLSDFQFLTCALFGTVMYAYGDLQFDAEGYSWGLVHVLCMTCYAITVRMRQDDMEMGVAETALYNNAIPVPIFFLTLFFDIPGLDAGGVSLRGWGVLAGSCAFAAAASISSFATQKVVSPTSWLTLLNACKMIAILFSYLFFGGLPSWSMVCGMAISLASVYLYAFSRLEHIRPVQAGTFTVSVLLIATLVSACSSVEDPLANGCGTLMSVVKGLV